MNKLDERRSEDAGTAWRHERGSASIEWVALAAVIATLVVALTLALNARGFTISRSIGEVVRCHVAGFGGGAGCGGAASQAPVTGASDLGAPAAGQLSALRVPALGVPQLVSFGLGGGFAFAQTPDTPPEPDYEPLIATPGGDLTDAEWSDPVALMDAGRLPRVTTWDEFFNLYNVIFDFDLFERTQEYYTPAEATLYAELFLTYMADPTSYTSGDSWVYTGADIFSEYFLTQALSASPEVTAARLQRWEELLAIGNTRELTEAETNELIEIGFILGLETAADEYLDNIGNPGLGRLDLDTINGPSPRGLRLLDLDELGDLSTTRPRGYVDVDSDLPSGAVIHGIAPDEYELIGATPPLLEAGPPLLNGLPAQDYPASIPGTAGRQARSIAGQDALETLYGPGARQSFPTQYGNRVPDLIVQTPNGRIYAHESKNYINAVPAGTHALQEALKDWELMQSIPGYTPVWHFWDAPPSPNLAATLEEFGITYIVYHP